MTAPDAIAADPFAVEFDSKQLASRSARGSAVTMVSQAIKMILQLVSQLVLARLLFPGDFGLIAMTAPVIGFVQVFNDIGLGQAIVQRERLSQLQVSSLFWINIGLSCVLAALVMLVAPLFATMYGEPKVVPLMLVLACLIPISALSIHPNALLSRKMRFPAIAGIEVAASAASISITIGSAASGLSYWSLVAGQATATITTVILLWIICGWRPSPPAVDPRVWSDLKFGANLTGASLANFASTSGDNIIVGLTSGRYALGLYDRSYKLVVLPLQQIMTPLSRVAVPLLSRLKLSPVEYANAYFSLVRTMLLACVPLMLVCIVRASSVVHILLGSKWAEAAPIFSWICVGGLPSAIYASSVWLFVSQDRSREMLTYMTSAALINVASFAIGSIWGIVGVAAVSATSFCCLQLPLAMFGATRRGPVTARDLIKCVAPFFVSGSAVFIALKIAPLHLFSEWADVMISGSGAYMLFALIVFLLPGGRAYFSRIRKVPFLLRAV